MDTDELIDRLGPLLKRHAVPLILATLGLIFLGYGLIVFFQPKTENDIVFEKADKEETPSVKSAASIMVDVQGAVQRPGVYNLAKDARIQDGLIAAGGLNSDASREYVAKSINLAAKLTDGTKIYIPFKDEKGSVANLATGQSTEAININTASESQLDSLSGIGQITAEKIINNRPYSTIEELKDKKVLSQSVFEKIKEKVTVY